MNTFVNDNIVIYIKVKKQENNKINETYVYINDVRNNDTLRFQLSFFDFRLIKI